MKINFFKIIMIIFALSSLLPSSVFSQKKQSLAQQVQNPISSLTTVPIQDNTSYEFGDHGQAQNVINIQPVFPMDFSKKLNLISRVIFSVSFD